MELNLVPTDADKRLIRAMQNGLPLVARPYQAIGAAVGMSEGDVIERLSRLADSGVIRRLGLIARHRELGYRANAMVVWDVEDDRSAEVGRRFGAFDFVTLCYRRPRRPPIWPYNLYCMIHGRDRSVVLDQVETLADACGVRDLQREVLFSARRFKQQGAFFGPVPAGEGVSA